MMLLAQSTGFMDQVRPWVEIVVLIAMPLIVLQLEGYRRRLSAGDQRFRELGEGQIKLSEEIKPIAGDVSSIKNSIDKLAKKDHEVELEGLGSLGQLRVEIEREFVRKNEFNKFAQEMREQHAEIMRTLRERR